MRIDELMCSLKTFELNLTQRKREKSIALKTVQEIKDESEKEDDEYALYPKISINFLKNVC